MRREYLYRKGLEEKQRAIHERKQKLKQAVEGSTILLLRDLPRGLFTHDCIFCLIEGRQIPTELRNETTELRHSLQFDDAERVRIIIII